VVAAAHRLHQFRRHLFLDYGDGAHNGEHGGAILPESLMWLWR